MEEKKKKQCVIYGRVSTVSREQDLSIEEQTSIDENSIFYSYLQDNNYEVAKIFSDRESGTTDTNRPGFTSMLDFLGIKQETIMLSEREDTWHYDDRKSNFKKVFIPKEERLKYVRDVLGVDRIICSNTSRFTRSGSFEIVETLRKYKIYVYFVQEQIDSKEYGKDILLKIIQILDRNKSEDISRKVKAGHTQHMKRNNTLFVSSRIYGFKYLKRDKNTGAPPRLVINPEEAEVVKLIYKLYTEELLGTSLIAKKLDELGYHPRQNVDKKTGELLPPKKWAKRSVQGILDNCRYAGLNPVTKKWDSGQVYVDKHYPKKIAYEAEKSDLIEPIISEETFYLAQKIKDARVDNNNGVNRGVYTGKTLFAQRIKCSCGAYFVSNNNVSKTNGERYYYYVCSRRKREGKHICNEATLRREEVVEIFDVIKENFWLVEEMNLTETYNRYVLYSSLLLKHLLNDDSFEQLKKLNKRLAEQNTKYEQMLLSLATLPTEKAKEPAKKLLEKTSDEINAIEQEIEKIKNKTSELKAECISCNKRAEEIKKALKKKRQFEDVDIIKYDIKLQIFSGFDNKKYIVKIGYFEKLISEVYQKFYKYLLELTKGDLFTKPLTPKEANQYFNSLSDEDREFFDTVVTLFFYTGTTKINGFLDEMDGGYVTEPPTNKGQAGIKKVYAKNKKLGIVPEFIALDLITSYDMEKIEKQKKLINEHGLLFCV